jgi:hypothetical protein
MSNRIYTGPQDRQPKTISNRTCAASLLPGTFVSVLISTVAQATTPSGVRLALLGERDFYSTGQLDANDPLKVAYASGDTAVAYELEPGQRYMAAVAAATYTNGQELTVAASGRLAAAATGNVVVAYYDGPNSVARSAGDLVDVCIANFYTKA